ncbi:MAG: arylsulfatase [Chloroflexota bacterium]
MNTSQKPNVVFILTDDQGYGDLACHGNPIIKTPNLDKMHSESTRLTNYHVGPTCAPTRAGLLTGHYANSTGVWHTIGGRSLLRQNEVSMADVFAENGYATGIFGKWHLGDNYPYRPQDRGFQEVVTHGGGGVGNTPDYWGNSYFNDTYWTQDGYKSYSGYCTDIWFNEGLNFIERHKDEPFFCYIPTNAPHGPFLVEPDYSTPYLDDVPRENRAHFYGMITNIDENFGVLRQKLDEWGLTENTIVIFMTDNGTACGVDLDKNHFVVNGYNDGMRGQKNSEYEGGHRVPFFMHWPAGGLDKGNDVNQVTANVDILPTLMELCGLDHQGNDLDFDGTSIVSLIHHETRDWPDRAMVTDSQRLTDPVKWRKSAVMTYQWRLINGTELYDIQADPEQRQDIASHHPDKVAELRQHYEGWWAKVSRQFDEDIPIVIGDADSKSVRLNSHDWRNPECDCVWNQHQVREGLIYNGHWEIDVAEAGQYRFELRRWPKEEDRALADDIPGDPIPMRDMTYNSGYGGGNAIAIQSARLTIADQDLSQDVTAGDKGAVFKIGLAAGQTHFQTYFYTEVGEDVGAYYVYIELIE